MAAGRGTAAGASRSSRAHAPTSADAVTALSRPTFRALGAARWAPSEAQLTSLRALASVDPDASLGDVFDLAYELSARTYRSEYYYKNLLVNRIVFGRHSPRTASALVELGAGRSIADLVVLNGSTTAYEIKTDYDDFSRLPAQLEEYRVSFERTYVVVSHARVTAALRQVPEDIGVLAVDARGRVGERRPARSNLDRLTARTLFRLLHQDEVLDVLARTLSYQPDVPSGALWDRTLELFCILPTDLAHRETTRQLRVRGQRAADLALTVPRALRARAYDVPMSRSAAQRITQRLEEKALALLI